MEERRLFERSTSVYLPTFVTYLSYNFTFALAFVQLLWTTSPKGLYDPSKRLGQLVQRMCMLVEQKYLQ